MMLCFTHKVNSVGIGGNHFTFEGLNPSPNDLEQLFETLSNDEYESVQIQRTPSDSNNPSYGCAVTTNIRQIVNEIPPNMCQKVVENYLKRINDCNFRKEGL